MLSLLTNDSKIIKRLARKYKIIIRQCELEL